MGLKEPEHKRDSRWSHPPKKKWIHCYMSIDEETRNESPNLKSNEIVVHRTPDSHPVVTYSTAPLVQVSHVNQLDHRAVSLTPVSNKSSSPHCYEKSLSDERYSQRRRAHHHPYTPLNSNLRSPIHVKSDLFGSLPPSHSLTKSLPVQESNSLGLLHSYKVSDSPSLDLGIIRSLSVDVTSSARFSPEAQSGTLPPSSSPSNGFSRSSEDSKLHSPLSRDFDESKDDQKKRLGNIPSREVHNKLEKNRRAHLKECFETLRRQLPAMEDKKISNQTILKAAHRFIQGLKRKEREYEHEMERLARQKIAHQQQLASLKKELQAKWDHIDFSAILPDMASLEQQKEKETKSTTTASEQPDFEDESHESTGHSNSLTFSSSPELKTPTYVTTQGNYSDIYNSNSNRESYLDPNQPLNLSTSNVFDEQKSPMRHEMRKSPIRNQSPSISPQNRNGEWPLRRNTQVAGNTYAVEDTTILRPVIGKVHAVQGPLTPQNVGVNRTTISTYSTNTTHISPVTINCPAISHLPTVTSNIPTSITHISQLVKSGTTVSSLPSMAKVVTKYAALSALPHSGTTVTHIPNNSQVGTNISHIHTINNSVQSRNNESGIRTTSASVAIGTNITHVPQLTAIARMSGTMNQNTVVNGASHHHRHHHEQHSLPLIGGNGISIPAHLVASGMHLNGTHGTILGQPAIQLITPDGYKLLPAEHMANGVKPLAITLSHSGLEHLSCEDGKSGPVVVAVNKNGLSALHLTVPASARAAIAQQGHSVPVTSVPLNLTVAGASGTTAVKVTQTGTATSIIPSYLPLTHANGITQLVQGMSLVGPIVVSQSQRGVMVSTNSSVNKSIKGHGLSTNSGTTMPLVPAQYANTLNSGLVNSVVVVSASTVMSHSSVATNTIPTVKH